MTVDDIDWQKWIPSEEAVLCFVIKYEKVLLINKKTGLGKGLINGPGGRVDPGETALKAAIRETEEEVCIVPNGLKMVSVHYFHFLDGYKLKAYAYIANDFEGVPASTDEADPFWCDIDKVPYEKMWEDDKLWLPDALKGKKQTGYFTFDGEKMLSEKIIKGVLLI